MYRFRLRAKKDEDKESIVDNEERQLKEWKAYCLETAVNFNQKGRWSMPILQQRKLNPSSFKWANVLHMSTPTSTLDQKLVPVTNLKAFQERYKTVKRDSLSKPKVRLGQSDYRL